MDILGRKDGIKRTEDGRVDLEWWDGLSIREKMRYEVWQAEVPPRGTPGANRRKHLKETFANASTEEILFKEVSKAERIQQEISKSYVRNVIEKKVLTFNRTLLIFGLWINEKQEREG